MFSGVNDGLPRVDVLGNKFNKYTNSNYTFFRLHRNFAETEEKQQTIKSFCFFRLCNASRPSSKWKFSVEGIGILSSC